MAQRVGFTHAGINFESQYQIENPPAGDREILYLQRTVKIDIFVFGAEGTAAYKTGPVCSMPASCAGAIFNSGRSFR